MRPRLSRSSTSFVLAGALLLLLGVLAVLQHRWIGEISRAERERLAVSLSSAAERFADDLDREVMRVFTAFAVDPRLPAMQREAQLAECYARWTEQAGSVHLLRELFVARREDGVSGGWRLRRFEPRAGRFDDVPWPAELEELRAALDEGPGRARGPGRRGLSGFALGGDPLIAVPHGFREGEPGVTLLRLDRAAIAGTLLPELAARHFGSRDEPAYELVVVRRGAPQDVIYRSDAALSAAGLHPAEAGIELLAVRPFPELHGPHAPLAMLRPPDGRPEEPPPQARDAPGALDRRPPPRHEWSAGRGRPARRGGEPRGGAWVLLVRPRGGSLEALVARTRARNLAASLGVLSLLAASIVFLALSTRRAQALARQQMEFVAGVTHELHTPLAGIRSAAQNLKDGVVAEAEHVRRYGGLIERESRRLSDMLQQVLDFAGIQSGRRALRRRPVRLEPLIEDALSSCRFAIDERGASVETEVAAGLPELHADPAALRGALRNLVQNAVKYGGGWVRVSAAARGAQVEIRVEDRGPGIAPAERARIFEPFYRGANATEAQAPGSGLGLSIVRDVAEAHGGSIGVSARPGGGSCFILRLPALAGPSREGA